MMVLADLLNWLRKNSAGIRTSFSNIKTAVVKGLANVITAIDEGMQNAGLGSIAENFDKIKNAVNVAFKAITDSIPPAISFLTNLWDTIKPFLPLIMAVIGYISIYQGVMGTARKAVELYNGAQKMMNVLMNLNPIGLIIAAVIALVAGFIYLWNTSEDFRNFWIGLWEGIKKSSRCSSRLDCFRMGRYERILFEHMEWIGRWYKRTQ